MQVVELKLIELIDKNPHLMNVLNRTTFDPLIRKNF